MHCVDNELSFAHPKYFDMFLIWDLGGTTFVGQCLRSDVRSLLCPALTLLCAHHDDHVDQYYNFN